MLIALPQRPAVVIAIILIVCAASLPAAVGYGAETTPAPGRHASAQMGIVVIVPPSARTSLRPADGASSNPWRRGRAIVDVCLTGFEPSDFDLRTMQRTDDLKLDQMFAHGNATDARTGPSLVCRSIGVSGLNEKTAGEALTVVVVPH